MILDMSNEGRQVFSLPRDQIALHHVDENAERQQQQHADDDNPDAQHTEHIAEGAEEDKTESHAKSSAYTEIQERRLLPASKRKRKNILCYQQDEHSALVRVGHFTILPSVTIHPGHIPVPFRANVKVFLNPGWILNVSVSCENCTKGHSMVVLKPMPHTCLDNLMVQASGGFHDMNELINAETTNPDEPYHGVEDARDYYTEYEALYEETCKHRLSAHPCTGLAFDNALAVGYMNGEPGGLKQSTIFVMKSDERMIIKKHEMMSRQYCFYDNNMTVNGTSIGDVTFHLDGEDMQAFVSFIIFFGVAMPIICVVAGLLQVHKFDRCRQIQRQGLFDQERERMERELIQRGVSPTS